MSDTSSNGTRRSSEDTLRALIQLANSPRLLKVANTETTLDLTGIRAPSSNATSTSLVDVQALAEQLMFQATTLVTTIEQLDRTMTVEVGRSADDTVEVSAVLKGGAAVAFSFALMCMIGNQISGTILLHPLLAWLLILSSIGFYLMGKVTP